jgi:hypothetical protein
MCGGRSPCMPPLLLWWGLMRLNMPCAAQRGRMSPAATHVPVPPRGAVLCGAALRVTTNGHLWCCQHEFHVNGDACLCGGCWW